MDKQIKHLKYKEGDWVKIRYDLKLNMPYGCVCNNSENEDVLFNHDMKEYINTIQKIEKIDGILYNLSFVLKNEPIWSFTDEMIERKATKEEIKERIKELAIDAL